MIVIGLNGQFRHGKTYVAQYITERAESLGLSVAVVSFAAPLKALCKRMSGHPTGSWEREIGDRLSDGTKDRLSTFLMELARHGEAWDGVTKDEFWRDKLQRLGTDIGRAHNDRIWVSKWLEHVKGLHGVDVVLSDDMRFENEVEAIESLGGVTCRVVRLNDDDTPFREEGKEHLYSHSSEKPLQTSRIIKCYSGDLEALRAFSITVFESTRGE